MSPGPTEKGMSSSASGGYHGPTVTGEADLVVDLRSDTLTKPSQGMREAIANAIVGDDVFNEDPTTKELEKKVAMLLGKEEALFVSSGTQGNLISALVHCNVRGSEMICGDKSHMFVYEQGNISQFGGIHSCQMKNEADGTFSLETLEKKFRTDDVHFPVTKLVCVENTHNSCGGKVLPLPWLDSLVAICKKRGVRIHMDGARLFNASVASGVSASRIVRDMDSVSICLSKGLGSPAGSIIVGSKDFIYHARRMRKALGGGMRQVGILAAAGLFSIENMIERLREDHDNAKTIAFVVNSKGPDAVRVDMKTLQTNIVILQVEGIPAPIFCELLASVVDETEERKNLGGKTVCVKSFPLSESTVRLVLHCDISKEMAEAAAMKVCYVASKLSQGQA